MKNILILLSFFIMTPVFLIASLIVSLKMTKTASEIHGIAGFYVQQTRPVAYAALPVASGAFDAEIVTEDAKVEIVRQFLAHYNSPLEEYAQYIVDTAEKYDLDYRLIPAIGMQESNLCLKAPEDSYNCWGFGIYGKNVHRFKSFEEGIEAVTKTLAVKYKEKHGLATPEEIVRMWTPSDTGRWVNSVNHFMSQLQ